MLEVQNQCQQAEGGAVFFLAALGNNLFPGLFQLLEAAHIPGLVTSHNSSLCFCCDITFTILILQLPSYMGPHDSMGPQDRLGSLTPQGP